MLNDAKLWGAKRRRKSQECSHTAGAHRHFLAAQIRYQSPQPVERGHRRTTYQRCSIIERFYNPIRGLSTLRYLSPIDHEKQVDVA